MRGALDSYGRSKQGGVIVTEDEFDKLLDAVYNDKARPSIVIMNENGVAWWSRYFSRGPKEGSPSCAVAQDVEPANGGHSQ